MRISAAHAFQLNPPAWSPQARNAEIFTWVSRYSPTRCGRRSLDGLFNPGSAPEDEGGNARTLRIAQILRPVLPAHPRVQPLDRLKGRKSPERSAALADEALEIGLGRALEAGEGRAQRRLFRCPNR